MKTHKLRSANSHKLQPTKSHVEQKLTAHFQSGHVPSSCNKIIMAVYPNDTSLSSTSAVNNLNKLVDEHIGEIAEECEIDLNTLSNDDRIGLHQTIVECCLSTACSFFCREASSR